MKPFTQARVQELLHYDPLTGIFRWKIYRGGPARKGDVAGHTHVHGHHNILVDGVSYNAGMLAWVYVTGVWPRKLIDHKNMRPADNRFENLREATYSQNAANRKTTHVCSSQFKGVSFHKRIGKWNPRVTVRGKTISLGIYSNEHAAAIAYDLAAHKHFGEFAVLNFPNAPKRDWILV